MFMFKGKKHTDYASEFMLSLGMSEEQIESVLNQKEYEDNQALKAKAQAAQDYLDSTDYMDNKYVSEVLVLGTTTAEDFKINHSEVYDKREAARVVIRSIEG